MISSERPLHPGQSGSNLEPSDSALHTNRGASSNVTQEINREEKNSLPVFTHDVGVTSGTFREIPPIKGRSAKETMVTLQGFDRTYSFLCDLPNDHFNAVTVGIHSEQVMHQLLRYPFHHSLGLGEIEKLKILISCHDLEKYPANGVRDHSSAHEEHQRAEKWLRHFAPKFGLNRDEDIELAVKIIHSEILSDFIKEVAPARPTFEEKRAVFESILQAPEERQGEYYRSFARDTYTWILQSRVSDQQLQALTSQAVDQIAAEASACGASIGRYFKYAVAFYQCDCSAYSRDCISESTGVRGPLSVEFLFEQTPEAHMDSLRPTFKFDHMRGRIKMRGFFDEALSLLEQHI